MGHWKDFFKNSLTLGFYNILIQGINFLSFTFLARFLDPSEFGLVAIITVFSGFLIIFSDAGLSYAVVREDFEEEFLEKLNVLSILIGILLMSTLLLLAKPIAWMYDSDDLFLPAISLSSMFLLQSIFLIPKAKMQKQMAFNKMGRFMAIGQTVVSVVAVTMAYLGYSYWSLIFSQIIGLIIQAILFIKHKPIKFVMLSLEEIRTTIAVVRSLLGNVSGFNMINYWARNADNLLIGKFYGESALGIYNYAYKLFYLPQGVINSVFSQMFLPSFKKMKDDGKDVQIEYLKLLGAVSFLITPMAFTFVLIPELTINILLGDKWLEVAEILPYFGVCLLLQPLMSPIGVLLVFNSKEKDLLVTGVINSVIAVLAISLGLVYSIKHIAFFYAIATIALCVPVAIILLMKKALNFSSSKLLIFWLPRLAISLLMLLSIWFGLSVALYICVSLYTIMSLFLEAGNIRLLTKTIRERRNKNKI